MMEILASLHSEPRPCCRKQKRLHRSLRVAAFCFFLATQGAHAATFTATLDQDTITLGESATLSLNFSGAAPENIPGIPPIANLRIDHVGQTSQTVINNGQISSVLTHTFTVTARQPGEYTIPALNAKVGNEQLTTQPLTLKVLKPTAPSPEAVNSGSELAFLKLELPKKEVYLGEIITGKLNLFIREGVQNIENFQLTSIPAEGFNVGKMVQGNSRRAQVGGANYTTIPLGMTFKAIKTGHFTIGPITASVILDLPSARRSFFGPMVDQKPVSLVTETQSVQALPLPAENIPTNFNGAVGNYRLAITAGPTNVAAGDPVTVRIQITGRGDLEALTLPEQTAWRGFKTYPPTSKIESGDPFGIQGTKTFEELIVPQSAELKEIPPFAFSFFDPDRKSYQTTTQPAIALVVRPSASAAPPTVVAATGNKLDGPPPVEDIVANKQRLGTVALVAPPLVQQPWFLALQSLPCLALVSALVWRKRNEMLANNPRLRRQRRVAQIIRDGLIELRQLATTQKSDEFFATLFHLLQERIGERLDLPASSITEAVLEDELRPCGVQETLLTQLHELFQTCNLARYAPIKTSQELAAIIPKVEEVLRELQKLKL